MAVEQARRLGNEGQRVALLCYSHGLASYLKRITKNWSRRQQPGYVGEFHTLGIHWGATQGPGEADRTEATAQFFEHDLPKYMLELATNLDIGQRFDSIVIDEAQDFADSWWDPVLAALKDPDTGGIYVFSDEGQRVFDRQGTPPVPLVPLILDHNIRNTRQIATACQPLVDHPMRYLGGDGPDVTFVACQREDAMDVGDDQIDKLLDDGWRPEDVALLTTGSRHPEQIARQAEGTEQYWDSFWDAEQVFYGHVLGFKGSNGAPSFSSSTTKAPTNAPVNASTSGCPGPVTNSSSAATPTSSPTSADPTWPDGWASSRTRRSVRPAA
jgi:hypothetical protein